MSVVLLGYQQAELFREAIESAVTQVTDFPFEIVVRDDASTDGTADIAREYEARHPGLVRAHCAETNVGPYANLVAAHNLARGDYVAHLDGDDLFLPGKLQAQADYLDAHPDVSVVWHAVRLIDRERRVLGRISMRGGLAPDGNFTLADALEIGSVGVHSAQMYRRAARTTTAPGIDVLDWYYAVEFLSHGRGHELAQELGVYRRLEGTSVANNAASRRRMRRAFAIQMEVFAERFPEHRRELFTLALLLALADLRGGHSSFAMMGKPLLAARSVISPARFLRAFRRFRAASRGFQGLP